MRRTVIPVIACVLALLAAAFVSVRLAQAERSGRVLTDLYRAALDEAREDLDEAELAVEKLLISADSTQQAALLSRISRAGMEVTRCLSVLPVEHGALPETMAFGNRLADYADSLLLSVTSDGPLPASELSQLEAELAACMRLAGELALAGQDLSDLRLCEPSVTFPSLNYAGVYTRMPGTMALTGENVTADRAEAAAALLAGADVTLTGETDGDLAAYVFTTSADDGGLTLAVTRRGGKLLWMTGGRAGGSDALDEDACVAAADAFLAAQGLTSLRPVWRQSYDGLYALTYAAVQDGTVLYADLVRVQVRRDDGGITGYDASDYWRSHAPRTLPQAALTQSEAAALLSPAVRMEAGQRCLLPLRGREVLCYEFRVIRGGEMYLIYLDAQTGREVLLQKVVRTPGGSYAARQEAKCG